MIRTQHATNMKRDVLILNMEKQLTELVQARCGKTVGECTDRELYYVILYLCKDLLTVSEHNTGEKKVYYISSEFMIGRMLSNNLINMGIYEKMRRILASYGKDLGRIVEIEPEPSLGAGGLGRLSAAFMDSMATLGIYGEGIGLMYSGGEFRQSFAGHLQTEGEDPWIEEESWLEQTDVRFDVRIAGRTVHARMYRMDVAGFDSGTCRLCLFDVDGRARDMALTERLVPEPHTDEERRLRLRQEYFLACCAAQLILREMRDRKYDLRRFYEHCVIQINDTHPSLIIPELIRILVHDKAFSVDEAIDVVRRLCAYTDHTIMTAGEIWSMEELQALSPQIAAIIRYLDKKVREKHDDRYVHIIDGDGGAHMAAMDIHCGFSVNGVSAIQTEFLKRKAYASLYRLYPEKFSSKTNGISFRRWLHTADPELAAWISSLIGEGYRSDPERLDRLIEHADDVSALERLIEIKHLKKQQLAAYIAEREGVELSPDSIFDMQIKRVREYKRQHLNALDIARRLLDIRRGILPVRPISFILGGKAAPGDETAQDILHFILVLQEVVNADPVASKHMRLVFVTDYNVTWAERLVPACDVSSQLSAALTEGCGTDSMKLMLNGAVTTGTADGAILEIAALSGDENIFLFGRDAAQILASGEEVPYDPAEVLAGSAAVREAVEFIVSPEMTEKGDPVRLGRLHDLLVTEDSCRALGELEALGSARDRAYAAYENRHAWAVKMLTAIARAGYFSADRAVAEYERDIWKLF